VFFYFSGGVNMSVTKMATAPEEKPYQPNKEHHERAVKIKRMYHEGVVGVVRAGMEMAALKSEIVGSGGPAERRAGYQEWSQFCEYEGWPKTHVNRLCDVGVAFAKHLDVVTQFDLSALYSLARAPKDVLATAVERAKAGEFITRHVANEVLGRKFKSAKRSKPYEFALDKGKVLVVGLRRLVDIREALAAALAVLEARLAKRKKQA
jgi:hypothetical protein